MLAGFNGTPYSAAGVRWWPDLDGEEYDGDEELPRHVRMAPAAYLAWTRNASRRARFFYYARQYGGFEETSGLSLTEPGMGFLAGSGTTPYNVIASATDTLSAKVLKNRPEPMYMGVGADHRLRRRIRFLNRFVPGLFKRHRFYDRRGLVVRDAGLYGTGSLLILRDANQVSVENLFPWEIVVDPVDARGGDPRTLYVIRYLDKGKLIARYPDHEEAIDSAPALDDTFMPLSDAFGMSNRCTVIQAWHLPSRAGVTKDGRYSVCLLDETLEDRQYDRDEYPLARLHKKPGLNGWWGQGIGLEGSGFQDRIVTMDERLEYAHRAVGGQIWLNPAGNEVYVSDMNDEVGVFLNHTPGMPPVPTNPQPVHEQTYEYFRNLVPDSYGFLGISQMSAQSQKPAGVTAALALQTLDDIETDRFTGFEKADEEFVCESARHMLAAVRDIADTYGEFRVLSAGRGSGEEIWWKRDVDLKEDSYVVQDWAVSILPKTPAAKMQRVLELGANGYFDKPQVLKYIGLPDTTLEETLMLAAREVADAQITAMLEHEDPTGAEGYVPPEDYQDCDYALSRAQAFYNHVSSEAIDQKTISDPKVIARLANLARYMAKAKDLSDKAKAEAMEMQIQAQQAAMQQQATQGAQTGGPAPGPSAQPVPLEQPTQPNVPVAPAAALAPAA